MSHARLGSVSFLCGNVNIILQVNCTLHDKTFECNTCMYMETIDKNQMQDNEVGIR
jgi:hypothetical protein